MSNLSNLRYKQNINSLYLSKIYGNMVASYEIPVMKSQNYTVEEIFEKKLLFLIPFHIFTHEPSFKKYNQNSSELNILKTEYETIRYRREELLKHHTIDEYTKCTNIDMSNKVLENIAQKYENVKKGVKEVMGGKILDYEAKKLGLKDGTKDEMKASWSCFLNL